MKRVTAERIVAEVSDTVTDWPRFADEAGVPTDRAATIGTTHRLELMQSGRKSPLSA
jgi:hypothetical protein